MLKNTYSVGQVNNYIKNMFTQDFLLRQICVKGEVSNCKYHSSGHIYFTIKDATGTLAAIMFAGNRRTGLTFNMKEGDQVLVSGSIEVYERDGKYQLYARKIELDGAGDLYQKFEALKRELEEMGMFDPIYKKKIPTYAKKIGVVTAKTGAAIQDIRNISSRRNPFVQIILAPAQVQGEGAAASIADGIAALEHLGVDVIIVGRGGGSLEDLWAFNEELVARAIFECSIPVISAVGHETDTTIADYVADMRAPTPSAAAELAVFDYYQTKGELKAKAERMEKILSRSLAVEKERLLRYQTKLTYLSPRNRLNENRKRLVDAQSMIEGKMKDKLLESKHRLALLISNLDACSPTRKLASGYAYIEGEEGKGLRSVDQVKVNQNLQIYLLDGQVKAKALEVKKNE